MSKQAYLQVNVHEDKSRSYDVNIVEKEDGQLPVIIEVNPIDETHAELLLDQLEQNGFLITEPAYRYY
jgi:hypothetical protein